MKQEKHNCKKDGHVYYSEQVTDFLPGGFIYQTSIEREECSYCGSKELQTSKQ